MGIAAYYFRIDKSDFWSFAAQLREFYAANSVLGMMAAHAADQIVAADDVDAKMALLTRWQDEVKPKLDEVTCDLQLFDEGDSWLIRVLEAGYLFLNSYEKQNWPLEPVFYNDKTDMPPGMLERKPTIDWVDEQINLRRYLMYPVISVNDADQTVLTRLLPADDESPA